MSLIRIAVVSSEHLRHLNKDDHLLLDALAVAGASAKAVAWCDPAVSWNMYDVAVIRSTWDYSLQPDEFFQWIDTTARATRLVNPPEVLRWNCDKRYLDDLARKGVDVVETRWVGVGERVTLVDVLRETGWEHAVIKPAISAGGRDTYRVAAENVEPVVSDAFTALVRTREMMVQPFLGGVLKDGEASLMYVDGAYTHAIRKYAKPGEFRVQDDWGGTVVSESPSDDMRALGDRALAAIPGTATYARVDVVRDTVGRPRVIELEAVEPEMFLRYDPASTNRLVRALMRIAFA